MARGSAQAVEESSPQARPSARNRSNPLRLILISLLVIVVIVVVVFLPVKDYLLAVLQWVEQLGPAGPVVAGAIWVPVCLLLVPGSIITLGTGALFGVVTGTIVVSIGSTIGACVSFLVGRFFARQWVEKKVAGNAKFAAIDEAVGTQGFKIVFLTRLSPVFPFNLLNYAYGLTQVRFWHYALASWVGMLPGTLMYVYLGSAAGSLAGAAAGTVEKTPAQQVLFWVGLVATVVVATLVTRIARKALVEATREEATASPSNADGRAE